MTNASLMAISPTMLFMFVLILLVSIYVYDQHKTQDFYLSIVTVDWFYGKLRAKLPILIDSVVNSSHNTVFILQRQIFRCLAIQQPQLDRHGRKEIEVAIHVCL